MGEEEDQKIDQLERDNELQQEQIDHLIEQVHDIHSTLGDQKTLIEDVIRAAAGNAEKIDRIERAVYDLETKVISREDFEHMLQSSFDRNLAESVRRIVWVGVTGIISGVAVWITSTVSKMFYD